MSASLGGGPPDNRNGSSIDALIDTLSTMIVGTPSEDVVRHYQAHLQRRRAKRPTEEYRSATDTEWAEFEEHFDKRKVEPRQLRAALRDPLYA